MTKTDYETASKGENNRGAVSGPSRYLLIFKRLGDYKYSVNGMDGE
jgi:hypothetical protein